MKLTPAVEKLVFVVLFVCLWVKPVAAQMENRDAVKWFNIALYEKDPQKAIAAYEKAIALEPKFTEALFNLGLIYKEKNDYARAEQYLTQALATNPDQVKGSVRLKILYELAGVLAIKGDLRASEEALRKAKTLTVEKKLRTTISFRLARLLCQQERYPEALTELKAGRQNDQKSRKDFDSFIAVIEKSLADLQTAPTAGNENVSPPQSGNEPLPAATPAVASGEQAGMETSPIILPAPEKTQEEEWERLYRQAGEYEGAGSLDLAVVAYENLLQQAPAYKDATLKLQNLQQLLSKKQMHATLEQEYAGGLEALKDRNWTGAIISFEKVLEINPEYLDVQQRLAEAQRGLDNESADTIVSRYYADGLNALNRGELGHALIAFEKVRKLDARYREVRRLIAEVEEKLHEDRSGREVFSMAFGSPFGVDSLYQTAKVFMDKSDWKQAVMTLEKLRLLAPDHREVVMQLAIARANMSLTENNVASVDVSSTGRRMLTVGGAFAVLIVLPLIGIVVFSPTARARFYLLRGEYKRASQIYEKLVAQKPSRVGLYAALANIYLLSGRKDESAMKVFRTVLQLNLASPYRDEINSILAQNYLTQGRSDADALKVLESALQIELRRKSARRQP